MMIRKRNLCISNQSQSEMVEFEGIPCSVIRRLVMYARIEFRPGVEPLRVIVPYDVDPIDVLMEHRDVILKKYRKLMFQVDASEELPMATRSQAEFHELVNRFLVQYARQLKVTYKEVRYRKMRRRWGSCRSDGTITFNSSLQWVPELLVGYIVFHELAHMLVRGHDRKFKTIIAREFPQYKQLDRELNLYGLRLLAS